MAQAHKFLVFNDGNRMPTVGLGTFAATEDEIGDAVNDALELGYTLIDTSPIYGNEVAIGEVLKVWLDNGRIKREDLFITSKVPPTYNRPEEVEGCLSGTLQALNLTYIDLYTIHFPFAVKRENMREKRTKDKEVVCDPTTNHVGVWKKLEELMAAGKIKSIGLSNFNQKQIEALMPQITVSPAVLQIEFHVRLQQPELVQYCRKSNIQVMSFATLGSKGVKGDHHSLEEKNLGLLELPEIIKIAKDHKKSPAQILIRFVVQSGLACTPKTLIAERMKENISVYDFELKEEEMEKLISLDRHERIFDLVEYKGIIKHPDYPF